jgi:hypothetical protein
MAFPYGKAGVGGKGILGIALLVGTIPAGLAWFGQILSLALITRLTPDWIAGINPALFFTLALLYTKVWLAGKTSASPLLKGVYQTTSWLGYLTALAAVLASDKLPAIPAKLVDQLTLSMPSGRLLALSSLFLAVAIMAQAKAIKSYYMPSPRSSSRASRRDRSSSQTDLTATARYDDWQQQPSRHDTYPNQ